MAIDKNFLIKVEGNKATTYVPMKDGKPIQQSGVTIGAGVDLGAQTEKGLRDMGVKASTIAALKPFFGKKKDEAVEALDTNGPVTLDDKDLEDLNTKILNKHKKDVKNWYNKNNTVGNEWDDLTDRQQTVALSVEYNHGKGSLTSHKFFKDYIVAGRWDKAAEELRNYYSSPSNALHSRRIKELQYLVGATVDGIAERSDGKISETDAKLVEYKNNYNNQQYMTPDGTGDMYPVITPMTYIDNLQLWFDEIKKSLPAGLQPPSMDDLQPSSRSQEPSPEATAPTTPSEKWSPQEEALFEELLGGTSEEETEEEAVAEEESDETSETLWTPMEQQLMDDVLGTTEDEEPVYVEEGDSYGDKDPIYGIF